MKYDTKNNMMQEIVSKKKIGERLKSLRVEKGMSQAEVSELFGLSRSHYSQVELGKQFPSYDVLTNIADYYGKSYEWILHGKEIGQVMTNIKRVMKEEGGMHTISGGDFKPQVVQFAWKEDGERLLSFVSVTEQFTYLEKRRQQKYIADLPEVMLPFASLSGAFRAFEVEGDVMEPNLYYQDVVVGKQVEELSAIDFESVYVIVRDQSIRIRRITSYAPNRLGFVCVSDNRSYKPEVVYLQDIRELWEVKAKFSFRLQPAVVSISQCFSDFESSVRELREEFFKIKSRLDMEEQ